MSYVQILHFIPTAAVGGVAITAGAFSILIILRALEKLRMETRGGTAVLIGVTPLLGFLVAAYNMPFPGLLTLPLAFALTGTLIVLALPPGRVVRPKRAGFAVLGASIFLLFPSLFNLSVLMSGYFANLAVVRGLYGTTFIAAMFGTLYGIAMAAISVGVLRRTSPVQAPSAAV